MIKLNELRIGNLVFDRGNKVLRIDYWERPNMIAQEMRVESGIVHPLTEEIEYLQPIPLTEEWLLKLGYSKCSFVDNHFDIVGHRIWKCNEMFVCEKNGVIIKYVHQLQNLVHALTGEELILNP